MGLFSFIGSLIGGNKAANAADKAGQLQYDAAMQGIKETGRQFDLTRADFQPYQDLGQKAVDPLGDLVGVNGAESQQTAIDQIMQGPLYQRLMQAGGDAITANASATGELRGGNTKTFLAQNSEDVLNNVIANQLSQYSGLVGIGSGASGAVGNFGANAVAQSNALRGEGAAAQAQAALTRGGIASKSWQNAGGQLDKIFAAIF